jgi:hypothetical protein
MKTRITAKNVIFKLRDVQQLAEQNFVTVTIEEWAAVCSHVKGVEQEYMSREHEMDSVMERILINADIDNNHAEDQLVYVSLTDCKILKITYKPSLKGGKFQINLY